MSGAWAGGSSRRWRTVTRPAVLARDAYRCQIALPGVWRTRTQGGVHCLGTADCVHHIHGKGDCAGCRADVLTHLQAACTPCNLRVGRPMHSTAQAQQPRPRPMTRW